LRPSGRNPARRDEKNGAGEMRYNWLFLILLLIIAANITLAQDINSIGIRSGIILSNQNWITREDQNQFDGDNKIGMSFGFYYNHSFSKTFSLQPEISYIQEGSFLPSSWNEYYVENGINKRAYSSLNYLSLIVSAKLKYKFHKIVPYVLFGPRFDLLISNSVKGFENPVNIDVIDYGFSVGVGNDFLIFQKFRTGIEFRYSQGINKIGSYPTRTDGIYIRNHSFEFIVELGLL